MEAAAGQSAGTRSLHPPLRPPRPRPRCSRLGLFEPDDGPQR